MSPLGNAFLAIKFDAAAVRDIYADKNTVRREIIGTALASVLAGVLLGASLAALGYFFPNTFSWSTPMGWFWVGFGAGILLALFAFAVTIGATHLLARWLGGNASIGEYLTAIVWVSVPLQLLSLALLFTLFIPGGPIVQLVATAYSFAVQIFVVRVVYSLSWARAFVAAMLPIAILVVVFVLLLVALSVWGIVLGIGALQNVLSGVL